MGKKAWIGIAVIIVLGVLAWIYKDNLLALVPRQTLDMVRKDWEDQAYLPPPLRVNEGDRLSPPGSLTVEGSIAVTNRYRSQNSLSPLKENSTLQKAAEKKIDDMFALQYFAHESPSGVLPSGLAKEVGYEYVLVGENLALGNFANDFELIQAWMNSPGHRANILNDNYSEIGIAVRQGMFEGKAVWLAVQEFGLPASACPDADRASGALIEQNRQQLKVMETDLDIRKKELDSLDQRDASYNSKANEYNRRVREYNDLVDRTKKLVADYNSAIEQHNRCLRKAGS